MTTTDTEPTYVNVRGSVPNGNEPWEEEWTKKSPEYSERSNEHSSYDPRVNDVGGMESRRSAHRAPPPPPLPPPPLPPPHPPATLPVSSFRQTPKSRETQENNRRSGKAPESTPGSQPTPPRRPPRTAPTRRQEITETYPVQRNYDEDEDDDDDDLEDSEGDLKPPPLRISQTKKYSDSVVPPQRHCE